MAATVLSSPQTTLTQLLPTPPAQHATAASKSGEWGDEQTEQYSKSWSNDAHTDLWSPTNDQARGPGPEVAPEYWGKGAAWNDPKWSDHSGGGRWNGPSARDRGDEWREWEKWEQGKGKSKGAPVRRDWEWEQGKGAGQERRDAAEW